MIKIAIADETRMMRKGLRRILEREPGIFVAGEAKDSAEALAHARRSDIDVLLLDLSMPGSGIEMVRRIHADAPGLGILILTMHDERNYAERAIRAGALGYLTKQNFTVDLTQAIRRIASGRPYITPNVAELFALSLSPVNAAAPHATLSDRELQVFTLLAAGDSLSVIADRLCLSVKTTSTHKARIMEKMALRNLSELAQQALSKNLIAPAFAA